MGGKIKEKGKGDRKNDLRSKCIIYTPDLSFETNAPLLSSLSKQLNAPRYVRKWVFISRRTSNFWPERCMKHLFPMNFNWEIVLSILK